MNSPDLKLFTDTPLLFRVGHDHLGRLLDRFRQLFPGDYRFPSSATDNDSLFAVLAQQFSEPNRFPEALIAALQQIESFAAPENVPDLHIPGNVPEWDRESLPLYHAIQKWLVAHPVSSSPAAAAPASVPPTQPPLCNATMPPATAPTSGPPPANPIPQPLAAASAQITLRLSVLFQEIYPQVRHDFFCRFKRDLLPMLPELPEDVSDDEFDDAVYALLAQPAFLPEPMRQALLAIQELADPEFRALLRQLVSSSGVYVEPSATAEHYAVAFWLRRPFAPGTLPALRDSLPVPKPTAKTEVSVPYPEEYTPLFPSPPASATAAPASTASPPGDLAAISRYPRHIISKLPADVREAINQLLRRRVSYSQIVAQLGPRAPGLNKSNLSRWKKTGYLLWLAEQQRREDAQSQIRLLFDLLRPTDNAKLHEATQQIAALRISQVLANFDPATLTQTFLTQPQAFVRLVQTLPNLSRAGIDCERLLVELADRNGNADPDQQQRGLSKNTLQYATQKLNLM